MKRIIWVILAIFFTFGPTEAHKRHGGRQFGLFYGSLASHGEWIEMSYGSVWRPHYTGHNWKPYSRGRWIWTDYGWYWNSYEPFGWATYHYGRWVYDDYYGWIWAPDDVWGPAWVEWRYDDDYIGWSPLPPSATFSINVGITFGYQWAAPVHYWNFVPCRNFSSSYVVNYVQSPEDTRRIYGQTRSGGSVRSVDRRIVNDGVSPERIERYTNEKIRRAELFERGKPGEDRLLRKNDRDRLEVYRPDPEEVRKEGATRENRRESAAPRSAGRGAQKPLEEMKRERTSQRQPDESRQRPEIRLKRPDVKGGNEGIRMERPDVKRERPEIKIQRPEVKREKPEVRRDKPDGRSRQSGKSGKRSPDA